MAQNHVENLQEIPYGLLESFAESTIDFESHADWTPPPKAINHGIIEGGVRFGTRFTGQSVRSQRSNSQASAPLGLTPISQFTDADMAAAFYEPDGFRTINGYVRRSPFLPLIIGGVGRRAANMLSGYSTPFNGKILTSFSPRLQLRADQSWENNSVIGIEPIALLFDNDQAAIGFTLVYLNRRIQEPYVASTMYETLVQVKFFRRDGSLISEVEFPLYQTANFAFARCGETIDIAGVQITNSSRTGFAIDNIVFGLPQIELTGSSGLQKPSNSPELPISDNPLGVELCSFYTS